MGRSAVQCVDIWTEAEHGVQDDRLRWERRRSSEWNDQRQRHRRHHRRRRFLAFSCHSVAHLLNNNNNKLVRRFHLKAAGPWRGMWQLSAPRLTLTLILPCGLLAVWRRWQLLAKRRTLRTHYDFQPIAVETLGPINESATSFLHDLGRRISLVGAEDREPQFLFQRISVAIQRFNAVLLHDGFLSSDHPD